MADYDSPRSQPSPAPAHERRIGIVGAGFTGALLAVHLIRHCRTPTCVLLFDRTGRFGPGLAYQTEDRGHLLNVRAANMSAFPDQPDHFLRWLDPFDPGPGAAAQAFASRGQYGRYLQDVLETARREAPPFLHFEPVAAEITDLEPMATGHCLIAADGTRHPVDDVVLCLGNFPPRPPAIARPGFYDDPSHFVSNPWDIAALEAIAPDRPVLILGSGLTMVDVVMTLTRRGHRAPLTVLSRHGLLPTVHQSAPPWPDFITGKSLPATVSARLALVRAEVRRAVRLGADWRSVVDSLRPHLPMLWRSLSRTEQRRFLRRLRPYWDIHRHRMAPEIAGTIEHLLARNRLTVVTGHLLDLERTDGSTLATIRPRRADEPVTLTTDVVINATGLATDILQVPDALIRNLLARGIVRPDPLAIGLDVSDNGGLIDRAGQPVPGLHALGPLTRSAWWEVTAVPELRNQATRFARQLAGPPP